MFALYLAEGKIEPGVVENMRAWQHSGFSVDQSVFLPAGDQQGIVRRVWYMTRVVPARTGHIHLKHLRCLGQGAQVAPTRSAPTSGA